MSLEYDNEYVTMQLRGIWAKVNIYRVIKINCI